MQDLTANEIRRKVLENAAAMGATTAGSKRYIDRKLKRLTPIDWKESLFTSEYGQKTTLPFTVPFLGDAAEGRAIVSASNAAYAGTATGAQLEMVEDFSDFLVRPSTTPAKIFSVARAMTGYAGEYAITAGTLGAAAPATAGAAAARGGLMATAKKILFTGFKSRAAQQKKWGFGRVFGEVGAAVKRAPGQAVRQTLLGETTGLAGSLFDAEVGGSRVRSGAYMNYLQNRFDWAPVNRGGAAIRIADDSYGMWSNAIPASVIDQLIEVFSENVGVGIAHMVPATKLALLGKYSSKESGFAATGISNKTLAFLGMAGDTKVTGIMQKFGVSGIVPELGEEFVGAGMRDLVHEAFPELAEEGNLEYLIDNIIPITLGMGLGIFGMSTAARFAAGGKQYATGGINTVDAAIAHGNSGKGAQEAWGVVAAAADPVSRIGVLGGRQMIDNLAVSGLGAEGSAALIGSGIIRGKFLEAPQIQQLAHGRVEAMYARQDISEEEKGDQLHEELGKLWNEFQSLPILNMETGESPALQFLRKYEIIDEAEIPKVIERIKNRINDLETAQEEGSLDKFYAGFMAKRVESELAKEIDKNKEILALQPTIVAGAFNLARKHTDALRTAVEEGGVKSIAAQTIIQRQEIEPTLEGEGELGRRIVSKAAELGVGAAEKADEALEELNRAEGTKFVRLGKDVETPAVILAKRAGFKLQPMEDEGGSGAILGTWHADTSTIFYSPAAIERYAEKYEIDIDRLYMRVIFKEVIRAHVTSLGKFKEKWLVESDKWFERVGARLSKDTAAKGELYARKDELYKGESPLEALEDRVASRWADFATIEFDGDGADYGDVSMLKSFGDALLRLTLPRVAHIRKHDAKLRRGLDEAGFDTSVMSRGQVVLAYQTKAKIAEIVQLQMSADEAVANAGDTTLPYGGLHDGAETAWGGLAVEGREDMPPLLELEPAAEGAAPAAEPAVEGYDELEGMGVRPSIPPDVKRGRIPGAKWQVTIPEKWWDFLGQSKWVSNIIDRYAVRSKRVWFPKAGTPGIISHLPFENTDDTLEEILRKTLLDVIEDAYLSGLATTKVRKGEKKPLHLRPLKNLEFLVDGETTSDPALLKDKALTRLIEREGSRLAVIEKAPEKYEPEIHKDLLQGKRQNLAILRAEQERREREKFRKTMLSSEEAGRVAKKMQGPTAPGTFSVSTEWLWAELERLETRWKEEVVISFKGALKAWGEKLRVKGKLSNEEVKSRVEAKAEEMLAGTLEQRSSRLGKYHPDIDWKGAVEEYNAAQAKDEQQTSVPYPGTDQGLGSPIMPEGGWPQLGVAEAAVLVKGTARSSFDDLSEIAKEESGLWNIPEKAYEQVERPRIPDFSRDFIVFSKSDYLAGRPVMDRFSGDDFAADVLEDRRVALTKKLGRVQTQIDAVKRLAEGVGMFKEGELPAASDLDDLFMGLPASLQTWRKALSILPSDRDAERGDRGRFKRFEKTKSGIQAYIGDLEDKRDALQGEIDGIEDPREMFGAPLGPQAEIHEDDEDEFEATRIQYPLSFSPRARALTKGREPIDDQLETSEEDADEGIGRAEDSTIITDPLIDPQLKGPTRGFVQFSKAQVGDEVLVYDPDQFDAFPATVVALKNNKAFIREIDPKFPLSTGGDTLSTGKQNLYHPKLSMVLKGEAWFRDEDGSVIDKESIDDMPPAEVREKLKDLKKDTTGSDEEALERLRRELPEGNLRWESLGRNEYGEPRFVQYVSEAQKLARRDRPPVYSRGKLEAPYISGESIPRAAVTDQPVITEEDVSTAANMLVSQYLKAGIDLEAKRTVPRKFPDRPKALTKAKPEIAEPKVEYAASRNTLVLAHYMGMEPDLTAKLFVIGKDAITINKDFLSEARNDPDASPQHREASEVKAPALATHIRRGGDTLFRAVKGVISEAGLAKIPRTGQTARVLSQITEAVKSVDEQRRMEGEGVAGLEPEAIPQKAWAANIRRKQEEQARWAASFHGLDEMGRNAVYATIEEDFKAYNKWVEDAFGWKTSPIHGESKGPRAEWWRTLPELNHPGLEYSDNITSHLYDLMLSGPRGQQDGDPDGSNIDEKVKRPVIISVLSQMLSNATLGNTYASAALSVDTDLPIILSGFNKDLALGEKDRGYADLLNEIGPDLAKALSNGELGNIKTIIVDSHGVDILRVISAIVKSSGALSRADSKTAVNEAIRIAETAGLNQLAGKLRTANEAGGQTQLKAISRSQSLMAEYIAAAKKGEGVDFLKDFSKARKDPQVQLGKAIKGTSVFVGFKDFGDRQILSRSAAHRAAKVMGAIKKAYDEFGEKEALEKRTIGEIQRDDTTGQTGFTRLLNRLVEQELAPLSEIFHRAEKLSRLRHTISRLEEKRSRLVAANSGGFEFMGKEDRVYLGPKGLPAPMSMSTVDKHGFFEDIEREIKAWGDLGLTIKKSKVRDKALKKAIKIANKGTWAPGAKWIDEVTVERVNREHSVRLAFRAQELEVLRAQGLALKDPDTGIFVRQKKLDLLWGDWSEYGKIKERITHYVIDKTKDSREWLGRNIFGDGTVQWEDKEGRLLLPRIDVVETAERRRLEEERREEFKTRMPAQADLETSSEADREYREGVWEEVQERMGKIKPRGKGVRVGKRDRGSEAKALDLVTRGEGYKAIKKADEDITTARYVHEKLAEGRVSTARTALLSDHRDTKPVLLRIPAGGVAIPPTAVPTKSETWRELMNRASEKGYDAVVHNGVTYILNPTVVTTAEPSDALGILQALRLGHKAASVTRVKEKARDDAARKEAAKEMKEFRKLTKRHISKENAEFISNIFEDALGDRETDAEVERKLARIGDAEKAAQELDEIKRNADGSVAPAAITRVIRRNPILKGRDIKIAALKRAYKAGFDLTPGEIDALSDKGLDEMMERLRAREKGEAAQVPPPIHPMEAITGVKEEYIPAAKQQELRKPTPLRPIKTYKARDAARRKQLLRDELNETGSLRYALSAVMIDDSKHSWLPVFDREHKSGPIGFRLVPKKGSVTSLIGRLWIEPDGVHVYDFWSRHAKRPGKPMRDEWSEEEMEAYEAVTGRLAKAYEYQRTRHLEDKTVGPIRARFHRRLGARPKSGEDASFPQMQSFASSIPLPGSTATPRHTHKLMAVAGGVDVASVNRELNKVGLNVPHIWDIKNLPAIGNNETLPTVFLMTFDQWRRNSMVAQYDSSREAAIHTADIENFVEQIGGLRGGDARRRVSELREALGAYIDIRGWTSPQGLKRQERVLGVPKGMDPEGLWNYFAKQEGAQYTPGSREVFDLSQEIGRGGALQPILDVANEMIREQNSVTEVALGSRLIAGGLTDYMSLSWKQPDGGEVQMNSVGSFRTGVGYRSKSKMLVSVIEGWSRGWSLKYPDGVESLKKTRLAVYEARHNKGLLQVLKLTGIVKKAPRGGQKGNLVPLEALAFKGYQAEPWVATYLNNATSVYNIKDIKNPYYKKWMHLTTAMKRMLLAFGPFHHHAFRKSFMYTVGNKAAGQAFVNFPQMAAASALSYGNSLGRVSRKRLNDVARGAEAFRNGQDLWRSNDPLLRELVAEGMTVQLDSEVRDSLIGGGYNPDEVRDMDQWVKALGEKLNNLGMAKGLVEKFTSVINGTREFQRNTAIWLFNEFGANLKAQGGVLKYRELLEKNAEKLKTDHDGSLRRDLAKQVAMLLNADFGGLDYKGRGGKLGKGGPRHGKTMMMARALLLASDWTESNLLTVRNMMLKDGRLATSSDIDAMGKNIYRTMWLRVISRAMLLQIVANALLAGMDDKRTFADLYAEAGFPGMGDEDAPHWAQLRWLMINLSGLSPNESRKFLSTLGHFGDPIKWTVEVLGDHDGSSLLTPLVKKGSPMAQIVLNAFTGRDWSHRRFTSWDELLGVDTDAGVYSRKTTLSDGTVKYPGDSKAGRYKWQTSSFSMDSGPLKWPEIPSFTVEQMRRGVPIPIRNLFDTALGSKDWFDSIWMTAGYTLKRTY